MRAKAFTGWFLFLLLAPALLYPPVKGLLDTENHENRELSQFPELSAANYKNIPSQLSAFYDDRLPFKNQLVRVHSFLERTINVFPSALELMEGTDPVTRGKDGWLFYTVRTEEENSLEDYLRTNRYSQEELSALSEKYGRLAAYLAEYGGEAVLFCPPNKENVYPEQMPDRLRQGESVSRMEEALAFLASHTDVTVISPAEALLAAKGGYPLYYKYDSHWNRLGAFVGEQELLEGIGGEKKSLEDMTVTTYGSKEGDLSNLLGTAAEDTDDPEYALTDYKPEVSILSQEQAEDGSWQFFRSDAADGRSVVLFRDSFGAALLDYLPKDFEEVWVTESEETAAKLIKEHKPELVVLEIVERRADCLENAAAKLVDLLSAPDAPKAEGRRQQIRKDTGQVKCNP